MDRTTGASGVLRLDAAIDDVAEEWERLADAVGAPPFVRPGWVQAWWSAFGEGDLVVATLHRAGELAAVLPLERNGRLRAAANWHSPHVDLVAADDGAARELLAAIMGAEPRSVELTMLDRRSFEVVRDAARAARRRVVWRTIATSPVALLETDFAAYEQGLPRKRRKDTRRRWRRLQEAGDATVQVTDGSEDLDALLAEGFAVEGSQWKSERGTAIVDDPQVLGFYTDMARWAARHGWLRLAFLRVDGVTVAFDLALVHDRVWYALKGGYDVAYRTYGPGTLLLWHTVQYAFEQGLERIELLGQSDGYKLDWSQGTTERLWLQAFPRSPAGAFAFAAVAMRERARPVARRLRRRLAERDGQGA